jgi:hypothetical protein
MAGQKVNAHTVTATTGTTEIHTTLTTHTTEIIERPLPSLTFLPQPVGCSCR